MPSRHPKFTKPFSSRKGAEPKPRVLPSLATAEQLAEVIQVSTRTIHNWADKEIIPTALRCGKVVRFNPPAVASALGIDLPEFRATDKDQPSPG